MQRIYRSRRKVRAGNTIKMPENGANERPSKRVRSKMEYGPECKDENVKREVPSEEGVSVARGDQPTLVRVKH